MSRFGRTANVATPEQVEAFRKGLARRASYTPGEMNKGERAYASHLEVLQCAGKIRLYAFEGEKLRLALRTFYTPDFRVVTASGGIEYHEIKPRKGERYWAREDAKLKIKCAADKWRDRAFFVVWPAKGGGWSYERVRSAEGVE